MVAKSLRHKFVSAVADSTDTTIIRPQHDWNDDHNLFLGRRTVTTTTDTIIGDDDLGLIQYNSASAVAAALPQAGTTGFPDGWMTFVRNRGAGVVTITPTTSTINEAGTLTLAQGYQALIFCDGTNYAAIVTLRPDSEAPPQCGRLVYAAANQLTFQPFNGDRIKIAGVIYPIPSGGIAISNAGLNINGTPGQNLAASTGYLVALGASAGVLTPLFYTAPANTHVTDTTAGNVGVEVINGAPGATLIGRIWTGGGSPAAFATTPFLASWFNRRRVSFQGGISNGSTTSTGYVAFGTGPSFVSWGDAVQAFYASYATSNVSGQYGVLQVRDETGATVIQATNFGLAASNTNIWTDQGYTPAEGMHTLTLYGLSSTASNTFTMANNLITGNLFI